MKNLSIQSLLAQYQQKTLRPRELIFELREQAIAQSDTNAWIYLLSESELDTYLHQLDEKSIQNLPLFGIPFAVKDNIDLADAPTTAACPNFSYVPQNHAFVVQQLINAGAIPLGKTNMDQFATGLVGTRSPYGQGKNVFNKAYISGGSSSGSAIACALGHVSFSLGTDTAGSGRVPAVLNNLIGLKPSKGLLSNRGVVPACRSLDCVSIFALNTDDAATVFDIANRYDPLDTFARQNIYENRKRYFINHAKQHFTFGIPDKLDFHGNQECERLFKEGHDALIALGGKAKAIDFSPFLQAAQLLYLGPWVTERWLATENVDDKDMLEDIRQIIKNGPQSSAADTFSAMYQLSAFKRQCDQLIHDVDFVYAPTTPTFFKRSDIDAEPIKNNAILGTYTNFMNLLDYAGCAVPIGKTACGVYWGATLFGQAMTDMQLLSYSHRLHHYLQLTMGASSHPLPKFDQRLSSPPIQASIDVAVCGAHLQGQPLNWQLTERRANKVMQGKTAAKYRLYALPDGKRPALVRDEHSGTAIDIEVWRVPTEVFGSFVAGIPSPLGIGKVELSNGIEVCGFICESGGLTNAKDISHYGGWQAWLKDQANTTSQGLMT